VTWDVDVEIQLAVVFEEIPPGGLAVEHTHAYSLPSPVINVSLSERVTV